MADVLSLKNVTKRFQDTVAVDRVSFSMPEGSLFGLLGPNGAGKTSLIRIITHIHIADEGAVYFRGDPIDSRHPRRIGYLPEERGLYKKMKVGEQLTYLARLKGLSKADAKEAIHQWMEKFEILDWWDKQIQELSKGMQQKIQFIATVVHEPPLLILDEPFSGLDPVNTNLIKDEIKQIRNNGTSVIFSTHRMEQVEALCEDIVLINKGGVILEGKVEEIKEQYKEHIYEITLHQDLPEGLFDNYQRLEQSEHSIKVQLREGEKSQDLLRELNRADVDVKSFSEVYPSLNDIFIEKVSE